MVVMGHNGNTVTRIPEMIKGLEKLELLVVADPHPTVFSALGSRDEPPGIAVETRAGEFAGVIDRIESGAFPPQPRRISDCAWCRYAGVCRKEYREGGDETAEPV